jgi:nucleotide-binding universal stress UspA family protein
MYERILVPIDGSETSNAGLREAIRLAKLTGAQVHLLHAVDDMPFVMSAEGYSAMSADVLAALHEAGEEVLQNGRAIVKDSGIAVDTVLFDSLSGRLCDLVAQEARKWHADLIVLGTHGRRGVGRMLLGSDAEQIVRVAPVSVLLVRAPAGEPVRSSPG